MALEKEHHLFRTHTAPLFHLSLPPLCRMADLHSTEPMYISVTVAFPLQEHWEAVTQKIALTVTRQYKLPARDAVSPGEHPGSPGLCIPPWFLPQKAKPGEMDKRVAKRKRKENWSQKPEKGGE